MAEIIQLTRDHAPEAERLLVQAFAHEPVLHVIFRDAPDFDAAMRALFHYSYEMGFSLKWPTLGLVEGDKLLGMASLDDIDEKAWPKTLTQVFEDYAKAAGTSSIQRYKDYGSVTHDLRPSSPNYYIRMIGVLPELQGRGYGKQLLAAVHELSDRDPRSTGVGLDASNPTNIPFYESAGYHVIGSHPFEDATIWGMFRPKSP